MSDQTKYFQASDCSIAIVNGLLVTKRIKKDLYNQELYFTISELLILCLLFIGLKCRSPLDFRGFTAQLMVAVIVVMMVRVVSIAVEREVSSHADYLFVNIGKDVTRIENFATWLSILDTLVALDPCFMLVTLLIMTLFFVKIRSIEIQLIGNEASHTQHLIMKDEFTKKFNRIMIGSMNFCQAALPIVSIINFGDFTEADKRSLVKAHGKSKQEYNQSIIAWSWIMVFIAILLFLLNQFLILIFYLSTRRLLKFVIKKNKNRIIIAPFVILQMILVELSLVYIDFQILGCPASKMAQDSSRNSDENCTDYFFDKWISKYAMQCLYFSISRTTFVAGLYFWACNVYLMYKQPQATNIWTDALKISIFKRETFSGLLTSSNKTKNNENFVTEQSPIDSSFTTHNSHYLNQTQELLKGFQGYTGDEEDMTPNIKVDGEEQGVLSDFRINTKPSIIATTPSITSQIEPQVISTQHAHASIHNQQNLAMQSQSSELQKFNSISELNWAWEYFNQKLGVWVQFGCIQCMMIESKYRKYIDSIRQPQHSKFHLQRGIINFQDLTYTQDKSKIWKTYAPENVPKDPTLQEAESQNSSKNNISYNQIEEIKIQKIRRTTNNKKIRPNSYDRYDNRMSQQAINQSNRYGLIDDRIEQWMAMNWKKHMLTKLYKSRRQIVLSMLNSDIDFFATPNQIMHGLVEAQIVELMKYDYSNKSISEHEIQNYLELWKRIFQMADDIDPDKPLTKKLLSDPNNKFVQLILYIYSMESFVFCEINKAMRDRNISKLDMFGPFVNTLCFIISVAQVKKQREARKAIKKLGRRSIIAKSMADFQTYRGMVISSADFEEQFNQESMVIRLAGLTSTTLDRDVALEFALYEDKEHQKQSDQNNLNVLLEIKVTGHLQSFEMNTKTTAFSEEEEVVLQDGLNYQIISISEEVLQNNKTIKVVRLRNIPDRYYKLNKLFKCLKLLLT